MSLRIGAAAPMIPRYSRPEMAAIWEPENRFRIWFEIEAHACDAQAALGVIPKAAAEAVWKLGKFEPERIDEIERETKHDVIAFLTNLAEHIGPDARFLHQGMTSSDVLDTCLAVQLKQASDILLADLDRLLAALKRRAFEHKDTLTIGRSHGIHAEPTTFGLKLAGHYAAFDRAPAPGSSRRGRDIATCAISGAVGTFANIDPAVERHVAEKMGLSGRADLDPDHPPRPPRASSSPSSGSSPARSRIWRPRSAISSAARCARPRSSSAPGQKGSSAMPHKRNPVLSENLTGLARLIRAAVAPALENITLWHERDISHSAVERVMAPDATIALDFALARLTGVIDKLLVYPEAMQRNLDLYGGLVHSQRVLLALTQAGMAREEAYQAVQRNAMRVWQEGADFLTLLKADPGGRGQAAGRRARGLLRPRLSHEAGGYDLQAGVRGRVSRASRVSTPFEIEEAFSRSGAGLPQLLTSLRTWAAARLWNSDNCLRSWRSVIETFAFSKSASIFFASACS